MPRSFLGRVGKMIMLQTLLLAAAAASGSVAAIPTGPAGDAFYTPPDPLPIGTDGTVVWARRFSGGSALPSASANYLILYEVISPKGRYVAVSGTVAIPRGAVPPQGWPLISWAHGTVGNAPQCAPSRSSQLSGEQLMLDGFVQRGYAVAETDYEGNGTPGLHPYLVATSSARDVTAMVIASRSIDPQIGREWIVMGHSEGGAAALATAALGQQLAPKLRLVGAVAYAPLSYPQGLLRGELVNTTPNAGLAILGLMIEGFSSADARIVPSKLLDADALPLLPELQERCIPEIMHASQWSRIVPRSIFRQQGEDVLQAFDDDLVANDPEFFAITVPTLLVQGLADALIASQSTVALRDNLHRNGTPVAFKTYFGATHGSVLAAALNDVAAWTAQRFSEAGAGAPASMF